MAGRKQGLIDRINRLIGPRTGHWLTSIRPGLPKVMVDDPRLLSYRETATGNGVALSASTASGSLHTFPLGPICYHPWVLALRRCTSAGDAAGIIQEVLEHYYSLVQPSAPADWLDVDEACCRPLAGLPAVATVMPWSLVMPDEALEQALKRAERERKGYGLRSTEKIGSPTFGPMAPAQIEAEARKLMSLYQRLSHEELDPSRIDYDVGAVFLLDDARLRWYGNAGRHRIAVMAALGVQEITLSVRAVVRRDEVDIWPQVAVGNIERDAALQVFDRLMDGRLPVVAEPWVKWVDRTEPG